MTAVSNPGCYSFHTLNLGPVALLYFQAILRYKQPSLAALLEYTSNDIRLLRLHYYTVCVEKSGFIDFVHFRFVELSKES